MHADDDDLEFVAEAVFLSILYLRCFAAVLPATSRPGIGAFNSLFEMLYYPAIDVALDVFSNFQFSI